ncbi:MAG: UDP-N-acetylglucosamine 4,6-dehydratase (inverting) [Candidatus Magasanikbacteria bacterium]|nr:UDP-N-acetylglucosamine 4,6-dehydratase (inverting) [Candidatus Magasanikbacteria bacterium]
MEFLKGKSVLVTGGTGSFGQKFIKTLLANSAARRIIIFSRDEFKQSVMASELSDPERRLRFFLGDVRDLDRLQMAFHGVDYVIHAAALKQVPLLEYNPFEAIKTNIIGTQNVITAAINQGVARVVLVSTDKAANPANLYGATKLCAERLMISGNAYGARQTIFGVVRYGNVVGSRGSLVQLVEDQRKTGTVMLTHEDMTRFWITLDQGVNLVLLALEKMHGGEIFIPKVPSMRVKEFLQTFAPDAKIKIMGIRPGEKLHEILVTPEEARHAKDFDTHYIILPEHANWPHRDKYDKLGKVLPHDFYFSSQNNTDWLTAESLKKLLGI